MIPTIQSLWKRDGRRFCAAALCVSMIAGNVANTVIAADKGLNEPYEFNLERYELYEIISVTSSYWDCLLPEC